MAVLLISRSPRPDESGAASAKAAAVAADGSGRCRRALSGDKHLEGSDVNQWVQEKGRECEGLARAVCKAYDAVLG